jgi:hypothetical protein
VLSEASVKIALNDFSGVVEIPLIQYNKRVLKEDPRNDGLAAALSGFFNNGGSRRVFIPLTGRLARLSPEDFDAKVKSALGGGEVGVSLKGRGGSSDAGIFTILFGAAAVIAGFFVLSNGGFLTGRRKRVFLNKNSRRFVPVPLLKRRRPASPRAILLMFPFAAACTASAFAGMIFAPPAAEGDFSAVAVPPALNKTVWDAHLRREAAFSFTSLNNPSQLLLHYTVNQKGVVTGSEPAASTAFSTAGLSDFPLESLFEFLKEPVSMPAGAGTSVKVNFVVAESVIVLYILLSIFTIIKSRTKRRGVLYEIYRNSAALKREAV